MIFLHIYVSTLCVPGAQDSKKKASGSVELELWTVVNPCVGAGDRNLVLCKSKYL